VSTSTRNFNDNSLEEIDELLVSGINQDQIALIESDSVSLADQSLECAEALRMMAEAVKENAKNIQEARRLIRLKFQRDASTREETEEP